jgi:uroporphyrinogen-III synthase
MLRVLVLRSAHQASELAGRLRASGLEPVLVPAIEIVEPGSFAELDAALGRLEDFHWLVFTSANAVEAFAARAGKRWPPGLRVAVIGPGTARAAEAHGLGVDLVPSRAVAESLAEALLPVARQADGSATRFLLVRAEQARDVLPEALRAAGGEVTIAPAYRTVVPEGSIAAVRKMFGARSNYPDAITFASSSAVTNLLLLLEASGLTLPPEIVRVSIGPVTSQALRELGLPADAEAAEATISALVESVLGALLGGEPDIPPLPGINPTR